MTSSFGLGVAARNTIRLLLDRGFKVAAVDVSSITRPTGSDATFEHLCGPSGEEAPYAINLFHLNPPEVLRVVGSRPPWLDMVNRLNVCVPFWELPRFPRLWLQVLRKMDAVLAPSRFIYESLAADLPETQLLYYPQSIWLPPDIQPDRALWGLPPSGMIFAMSFDPQSDLERKNPWAVVQAFKLLPRADQKTCLVIKLNGTGVSKASRDHVGRLRELAAQDPRVFLVDDELDYPALLSLYASCDAFVSLHRSEGLGLVIMEAMALGLPVVATKWSGTMDFTNEGNSCLVPCSFIPARGSLIQYSSLYVGRRVWWAEPNIRAAADCMRRLSADPTYRRGVGNRGRASITAFAQRSSEARWAGALQARWHHGHLVVPDDPQGRGNAAVSMRRQWKAYNALATSARSGKAFVARVLGK